MRIVWTAAARRDLDGIWDFIARDNRAAAETTDSQILSLISALEDYPLRGRPGRLAGTRELVVPGLPYLVIYAVRDSRVAIVRILHAARRWPPQRADSEE